MPGPIKPEEVTTSKAETFPEAVFEAFNELITQKLVNGRAVVKQEDVVALMVEKGLSSGDIYSKGWLNIEEVYRAKGWKVSYDKPAYDESYPATFTFQKKKRDA